MKEKRSLHYLIALAGILAVYVWISLQNIWLSFILRDRRR